MPGHQCSVNFSWSRDSLGPIYSGTRIPRVIGSLRRKISKQCHPGLQSLSVAPQQCPRCWHSPRMPLPGGGLGREGLSKLVLLGVSPG